MPDEAPGNLPPERFVVRPHPVWSAAPQTGRLRVDPSDEHVARSAGDQLQRQKLADATITGMALPAGPYRVRFGFSPAKITGRRN
jgi:hypothetical protein